MWRNLISGFISTFHSLESLLFRCLSESFGGCQVHMLDDHRRLPSIAVMESVKKETANAEYYERYTAENKQLAGNCQSLEAQKGSLAMVQTSYTRSAIENVGWTN